MMNIGNLGSKQSVGVKFKEGSGFKMTDIFVILIRLLLKATIQKESA